MNNRAAVIFMVFTVAYVLVAGCFSIHNENMRIRWLIDPFILLLIVVALKFGYDRWYARRGDN